MYVMVPEFLSQMEFHFLFVVLLGGGGGGSMYVKVPTDHLQSRLPHGEESVR